jgi:hypothetical protein
MVGMLSVTDEMTFALSDIDDMDDTTTTFFRTEEIQAELEKMDREEKEIEEES